MKGNANQNHCGTTTNMPRVMIVQTTNKPHAFIFEDFSEAIFLLFKNSDLRFRNHASDSKFSNLRAKVNNLRFNFK